MSAKNLHFIAVIVAAFLALSVPTTGKGAGNETPQIHKGMTEAQVEKIYGEPDERGENDTGTTWTYTNIGAKAFIPFFGAFSHSIKVIIVNFRHGRVFSYEIQQ